MNTKRKFQYHKIVFNILMVLGLLVGLCVCVFLFSKIDKRMKDSATSNLLSTTQIISDTMEGFIEKDLNSLSLVANFHVNGEKIDRNYLSIVCDSLEFEWIGIVDENDDGLNLFSNDPQDIDMSWHSEWKSGTRGYSDAYIGESGRLQIVLWTPIYDNNIYIGTVFGSVILTKYYTANVFTFYFGEGKTYLYNATDGRFILKSLGNDGTPLRQKDMYSLLLESGNSEKDVEEFKTAINDRKSGTAEFNFNGEASYLCFLPLLSSENWYVTTVIARDVLLQESAEVGLLIRIGFALLCVTLVFVGVTFAILQIRKAKENEARYRDSLFANISDNLDSSFVIYEKEHKKTAFVSTNVNRLFGLNKSYIEENIEYIFDWCKIPQDDLKRRAIIEGTFEGNEVREIEIDDKEKGIHTIRVELINAHHGQSIIVLTDITKEKQIQNTLIDAMKRAATANQTKNEFLSAMSHDLRTPINGIVGMATIADANLDDKVKVHECLTKISNSTDTLLRLINNILDVFQMERGKVELVEQPFNIIELVNKILNENCQGLAEKEHSILVKTDLIKHKEVIGDQLGLTRIATNLISNAIKYTPHGGEIKIEFSEKQSAIHGYGCYELVVQDNGIGISPEFQSRIFQPFEREEDVKKRGIQGTGLGMSIVKNLVDLMMGNITVESEKGKGTIVRVTVNIRLNQQKKIKSNILINVPVLVLSKCISVSKQITKILTDIGMKTEICNDIDKALELINTRSEMNESFRVIIIDSDEKMRNQKEMISKIISLAGNESEIIVLTDYNNENIKQEFKELAIRSFVSKPVYKYQISKKMVDIVTEQKQEQEEQAIINNKAFASKKILLVEDNDLNKEIAIDFLEMTGVSVEWAENGAIAVQMFEQSDIDTYDMIFMDIQMPVMDGYEATKAIRKLNRPDAKKIPIVAMTANALKKDEKMSHEAGMNDHLSKPISISSIIKILIKHIK